MCFLSNNPTSSCAGRNNGLIVDYCGILKSLRRALATFAGRTDTGCGSDEGGKTDPATCPLIR